MICICLVTSRVWALPLYSRSPRSPSLQPPHYFLIIMLGNVYWARHCALHLPLFKHLPLFTRCNAIMLRHSCTCVWVHDNVCHNAWSAQAQVDESPKMWRHMPDSTIASSYSPTLGLNSRHKIGSSKFCPICFDHGELTLRASFH